MEEWVNNAGLPTPLKALGPGAWISPSVKSSDRHLQVVICLITALPLPPVSLVGNQEGGAGPDV